MNRRTTNAQTAIGYARVSTEDQNLGPDAQRAAIEAWAARSGVRIAAWSVDQGVSGAAPIAQRKALLEAIAALRANGAGVLVAAKRDRLARDVAAAKTIEALARKEGAVVRTADGASDATGSSRVIQAGVHDLFAEYEREVIRERTTAALAVKKAKGERVGTLPYGFQVAADGVRLEPNEAEQAVITLVRGLRDTGVSMRGIVAALADKGVRGRTGKPLALTQIANMLRAASVAA
jgi:DNA invertase Pin-like site-specific DNA recombinase